MRLCLVVKFFCVSNLVLIRIVLANYCIYQNPPIYQGSITGACSATTPDAAPSFVLLAVQGAKLVCYVYEIGADGEVDVSKTEFSKPVRAVAPSSLPAGSGHPALLQSLLA